MVAEPKGGKNKMSKIFERIYFYSNGTERGNKVLNAKVDIINYLCKEKLTISECQEIATAIEAYIKKAKEQALDTTSIQYLLMNGENDE